MLKKRGAGGRPGNFDDMTALHHRFARRENTYHLALIVLREQARARGDQQTVFLISSVLQRANEGDPIKHDLIALLKRGS